MGAGHSHFLFFAFVLIWGLALPVEARPRVMQRSPCPSGTCGNNSTCSNGTCGNPASQEVTCSNGTCGTTSNIGPFQQGQFVGPGTPSTFGQTPAQNPTQTASVPSTTPQTGPTPTSPTNPPPASNATASGTGAGKGFRVINSEPVDITQFAKKDGQDLDRVMLNPNTPLYVKMKANESDGGLFWTFLVDPNTGEASGQTPDGIRKFNFNDPYEKESLVQVKKYLKGMHLDDSLRKFLKHYWPNEELTPEQQKAPETQVAQNTGTPNPNAPTHVQGPTPSDSRPTAAPAPQRPGQPSQARGITQANGPLQSRFGAKPRGGRGFASTATNHPPGDDWICDGDTCRPRNPLTDGPASQDNASSDGRRGTSTSKGRVVVNFYKMSPFRKACTPCDDLEDGFKKIVGYDSYHWNIGQRERYPTTEVVIEREGQAPEVVASIRGPEIAKINEAIVKARAMAN